MMHYENLLSLFLRGWTNTFLVGAVGDKGKRNGFIAISFCKFSQTEILPTKTKNTSRNERKTSEYFCHSSSWLLSENCYVYCRLQKCVCEKFWVFFPLYFSRYKCTSFAMASFFQYHSSPMRKYINLILSIYFPVALY